MPFSDHAVVVLKIQRHGENGMSVALSVPELWHLLQDKKTGPNGFFTPGLAMVKDWSQKGAGLLPWPTQVKKSFGPVFCGISSIY